jgi:hypothetical protein
MPVLGQKGINFLGFFRRQKMLVWVKRRIADSSSLAFSFLAGFFCFLFSGSCFVQYECLLGIYRKIIWIFSCSFEFKIKQINDTDFFIDNYSCINKFRILWTG